MLMPRRRAADAPTRLVGAPLHGVQLLTRYCRIERPYWFSFLEHYRKLGVCKIHACVQSESEARELSLLGAPLGVELCVHHLNEACDPSSALKQFDLKQIAYQSQYTLLVDVDEYLNVLNPSFTVEHLAAMFPGIGQFYAPWVLVPSINPRDLSGKGFWGHVGKPLVRNSRMKAVNSDHAFVLDGDVWSADQSSLPIGLYGFTVFHYWARSFRDCLLKAFCNRFNDEKSVDRDVAMALIRDGELPVRLRLLAYLDLQERFLDFSGMDNPVTIDEQSECHLLRGYLSESDELRCEELFDCYRQYLGGIAMSLPVYPSRSLQQVAAWLPSLKSFQ